MIKQGGKPGDKLNRVLDLLELSEDEKFAAKAFYTKEAGEEVLDSISFKDLSAVAPDAVENLAKELIKKKQQAEFARLFLLVFARGKSTCYLMFTADQLKLLSKMQGMDVAKLAAVYSMKAGTESYPSFTDMNEVFAVSKYSTDAIRRAIDYEKSNIENGRLILYAIYFRVEYQHRKPLALGQRGKDGSPLPVTEVEEEDIPLLFKYEAIVIENFARLYFGCVNKPVTEESLQKLTQDVENSTMPQELLPLAGTMPKLSDSGLLHKLTVGLSYWNYMLSDKLKNTVKFFIAMDSTMALGAMHTMSRGYWIDIAERGKDYDEVFGIDPEVYLRWVTAWNFKKVLRAQLARHPELYISLLNRVELKDSSKMLTVLKEEDEALYQKVMQERKQSMTDQNNEEKEKIIDLILKRDPNKEISRAYLRGESKADTIYPQKRIEDIWLCDIKVEEEYLIDNYAKSYGDKEFYRRCEVYLFFTNDIFFFWHNIVIFNEKEKKEEIHLEKVAEILSDFSAENLELYWQVYWVCIMYDRFYTQKLKEGFFCAAAQVFADYLKERRKETLEAFAAKADSLGRSFAVKVLSCNAQENKKEILAYSNDSAKMVQQELLKVLCENKSWEKEIKELLFSKKASERELAVKTLLFWQESGADYKEILAQILEKEKSAKIKELLSNALGIPLESDRTKNLSGEKTLPRAELVKQLHKGGKKRALLWAYETPFSAVHFTDSKDCVHIVSDVKVQEKQKTQIVFSETVPCAADEEYLQAVLLCYSSKRIPDDEKEKLNSGSETDALRKESENGCGISKNAVFLAEVLNQTELSVYVNELFDKWIAAGAEAKKRWVLYAAAIHGGSAIVEKLYHQIKEWPKQSRGAIACDAVRALSLNPTSQALPIVDGIARKFKFRQIRTAAGEALEFAADQLGITREQLADRIVPDLGFDEKMERLFDYGERKFLVTITTALEIEVFEAAEAAKNNTDQRADTKNNIPADKADLDKSTTDEKIKADFSRGKKLKTFPKPGKKDDETKAQAAYKEFTQIKKQLKTIADSQRQRLETALSTAREWDGKAWKQLFVKNPIMHPFAIGLIWGIYKNGVLTKSFRYMEDGSFNTEEEEEFILPEQEKIGLVHPVELTEEQKAAWKQQLEDYEIVQPFAQLDREVYTVTKEEADKQELLRFKDRIVNDLSLGSRLSGFGWDRGTVKDAGCFDTYYREDREIVLGVELHFSGSIVGGINEEVTICGAKFYKTRTMQYASDLYFLRDVPARYFSEIVWQLTKSIG